MSIWDEGNKMDNVLSRLQTDAIMKSDNDFAFTERLQARRKALKQIKETVELFYKKKGSKKTTLKPLN